MSYLCKLRRRKKVPKIFRRFISQERHKLILMWGVFCLYFNLLLKWQFDSLSKYDFYEFSRKIPKIVNYVLQ